jgi:hypothetical protein
VASLFPGVAISARCDHLSVQAHAAEAALQAGSANLGIFPFALSFTPGSPLLVNSTPAFTSACLMSAARYAVMGGSVATLSARSTISECTFARRASLDGSHPSSFWASLI